MGIDPNSDFHIGSSRPGLLNLALAWLSLAAGCTDVLSFLKLGDVFTSAMTGNTALLGIAIGQGRMLAASHSLTALFGFTLGAALATAMYDLVHAKLGARCCLALLFLIEIACLLGFAATWSASGDPVAEDARYGIILFSAIGMGIQGVAARKISSAGISTIVFTSALISIVTSVTNAVVRPASGPPPRANLKGHVGTFTAYVSGAILSGVLVGSYVAWLVWIPMATVLLALVCLKANWKMEWRAA